MKFYQALTLILVASKAFGKSDISWNKAFLPMYIAGVAEVVVAPLLKALDAELEEAQDNLDDSSS